MITLTTQVVHISTIWPYYPILSMQLVVAQTSKGSGPPAEITISAPYFDFRTQKFQIIFKPLVETTTQGLPTAEA